MFEFLARVRQVMSLSSPMLGRWNRHDNIDIKTTLANIDSCGDRLCGDVRETRAVIRKFHRDTASRVRKGQ